MEEQKQKRKMLDLNDRKKLEYMLQQGWDTKTIGGLLGRSESGICIEIQKNGGREKYSADEAQNRYKVAKSLASSKASLTRQGKTYEGSPHLEKTGKENPDPEFPKKCGMAIEYNLFNILNYINFHHYRLMEMNSMLRRILLDFKDERIKDMFGEDSRHTVQLDKIPPTLPNDTV
jgi:IS30 family transposase